MLYIDKLLEDGIDFGVDSLDFHKVFPVMEYLETRGVIWFSGNKPTELYNNRDTIGYTSEYVVVSYSEWKDRTCCGAVSNKNDYPRVKWVTPHDLMTPLEPEFKIKRGSL